MKYKKYKITWVDPTGDSGWHSAEEVDEFECEECVIEGYIFSKDKTYVKTFSSYSIDKKGGITFGDVNVLPTSTVIKMKVIK